MRVKIVAGNWKMNTSYAEAHALVEGILQRKNELGLQDDKKVVLIPPYLYLQYTYSEIAGIENLYVGAQDCSAHINGAYTGEVSAMMLQSVGCEYVIIGHSERRQYHQEDGTQLYQKVEQALEHDLRPIFCCGEPLEVRLSGNHHAYVMQQLYDSLFQLPTEKFVKTVIAYEPIWAIGTGKTATSEQAQDMHSTIRSEIEKHYGTEIGKYHTILYGGSCNAKNATELFNCKDVDGGLIGGASLITDDFIQIIKAL